MFQVSSLLGIILLARLATGAPAASESASSSTTVSASESGTVSSTDTAASSTATVPFASLDPNLPLWDDQSDPSVVSPVRGQLGASILGPDNIPIDLQNPDLLAPPTTDAGTMLV